MNLFKINMVGILACLTLIAGCVVESTQELDELNTFTDTPTKDMVLDSGLTVPMTLSSETGITFSD